MEEIAPSGRPCPYMQSNSRRQKKRNGDNEDGPEAGFTKRGQIVALRAMRKSTFVRRRVNSQP